jgi:hypothetical protein
MADQQLRAIEVRVAALLALELDARLKQDARSRSKPRSLDKLSRRKSRRPLG